eukprot:11210929-Lingulodinium_polyedra.AAC.1
MVEHNDTRPTAYRVMAHTHNGCLVTASVLFSSCFGGAWVLLALLERCLGGGWVVLGRCLIAA